MSGVDGQGLELDGKLEWKGCVCIIVMGVSGTGKTTLGKALAEGLGVAYIEGDELHPRGNVEKMSRGVPLSDEDRGPWLEVVREVGVRMCLGEGEGEEVGGGEGGGCRRGVVITCSALKKSYRGILRGKEVVRGEGQPSSSPSLITYQRLEEQQIPPPPTKTMRTYFVWINGPKAVLQDRINKRQGHFFKASMLDSQLNTLESPEGEEGVVVVPLEVDTREQVRIAIEGLRKLNI